MKIVKDVINDHLYRNTIWLIVDSIILTAFGFLFWTINARLFTPEQVGLGTTLISSMELIAGLSLLGFNVAIVRYLPKAVKKDSIVSSCFTLSALVALVISLVFILGLSIFSPKLLFLKEIGLYAILFIVFVVFNVLFILTESVFIVFRKAKFVLIKNIIFSVLKLAFPFALVFLGAFGIFGSWAIAALIALVVSLFFIPLKIKLSINKNIIKRMFKFSSGNYLAHFFVIAPGLILPLIITNLISPETTAYFYVALMISGLLFIIPGAISSPLIAESSRNKNNLKKNVKKAFRFTFILLTLGVVVVLIAGKYLLLLFGKEYSENGFRLLQILALSSIPSAITIIYIAIKNVQHKIKTVVLINSLMAISVLVLSYALLKYGLIGIGLGWLLGKSLIACYILYRFIKKGVLG